MTDEKVVAVVYENLSIEMVRDLNNLWKIIGERDVETLIFGQIDKNDKVVWEKQFSSVSVMPSTFGVQNNKESK